VQQGGLAGPAFANDREQLTGAFADAHAAQSGDAVIRMMQ